MRPHLGGISWEVTRARSPCQRKPGPLFVDGDISVCQSLIYESADYAFRSLLENFNVQRAAHSKRNLAYLTWSTRTFSAVSVESDCMYI